MGTGVSCSVVAVGAAAAAAATVDLLPAFLLLLLLLLLFLEEEEADGFPSFPSLPALLLLRACIATTKLRLLLLRLLASGTAGREADKRAEEGAGGMKAVAVGRKSVPEEWWRSMVFGGGAKCKRKHHRTPQGNVNLAGPL